MYFSILIDNTSQNPNLLAEHGFSLYFEVDNIKGLFDVGYSDGFLRNARMLGIDISAVDVLILSHGHHDHCGGLDAFLKVNEKALIYVSENVKGHHFLSQKEGGLHDISLNQDLLEVYAHRVRYITKNTLISSSAVILGNIQGDAQKPKGNRRLYNQSDKGTLKDAFDHELALLVCDESGDVLISGCTHNGIQNAMAAGAQLSKSPAYFVGGLHLLDPDDEIFETEAEVDSIVDDIRKNYPDLKIITGHCTGKKVFEHLSRKYPEICSAFYSGFEREL